MKNPMLTLVCFTAVEDLATERAAGQSWHLTDSTEKFLLLELTGFILRNLRQHLLFLSLHFKFVYYSVNSNKFRLILL